MVFLWGLGCFGAFLRVLKTIGHRGTETQRKAKAVFGFLCASASLRLMVFLWGLGRFDAFLRVLKTIGHRGTETQRKSKAEKPEMAFASLAFLCASVS
jgi:uncharacterized membrane protein YidH (DUF202 family)